MEYRIVTPFKRPPMTLNEQRRAHFFQVAKAKEEVATVVQWMAKRQGIPRLDRVTVHVTWFAPDRRRRDNDSLAPFLKATKDALVAAGVLHDDSSEYVQQDSMAVSVDKSNPRIEIVITEV